MRPLATIGGASLFSARPFRVTETPAATIDVASISLRQRRGRLVRLQRRRLDEAAREVEWESRDQLVSDRPGARGGFVGVDPFGAVATEQRHARTELRAGN